MTKYEYLVRLPEHGVVGQLQGDSHEIVEEACECPRACAMLKVGSVSLPVPSKAWVTRRCIGHRNYVVVYGTEKL